MLFNRGIVEFINETIQSILQELRCRDGGAHWYRSSAVLLQYHKYML